MTELTQRGKKQTRKKTRKAVMVGYFVLVVVVCLICGVQITTQVIARIDGGIDAETSSGQTTKPVDCVEGIRSLSMAVERSRMAVHRSSLRESEAVLRYRTSLEPEWGRRGAIRQACQGDTDRLHTLDAVIHLGFAEEQAIRRDAVELASDRQRVFDLLEAHLPSKAPAPTDGP